MGTGALAWRLQICDKIGEVNWSKRREVVDAGISEFWDLFCIGIEQVAESFGYSRFAREHHLIAVAKRVNSCLHVVRSKANSNAPQSIDVFLDKDRRRIFSRVDGEERLSFKIDLDGDRNLCLLDEQGSPLKDDKASALFLEKFLYAAPAE
jgi:hypothetical protein